MRGARNRGGRGNTNAWRAVGELHREIDADCPFPSIQAQVLQLGEGKLLDLFAAGEVVGYAYLEEGWREAVGQILVIPGAADVGRPLGAAGEPVLIFHPGANADAVGEGDVHAAAEGDEVIADRCA